MSGRSNRIAFILGVVAALLAWTAVAIRYFRSGEVEWTALAAGAFILSFALYARGRGSADPT